MRYVFDSNALIDLFQHYYKERFPSLWEKFDKMITEKRIISVREAFHEVEKRGDNLSKWALLNKEIFYTPNEDEARFVAQIFSQKQFQFLVEKKKMLEGGHIADPFIIAKAKVENLAVVTKEGFRFDGSIKPNAPKIPNICQHFKIKCFNLEGFMDNEKWKF